MSTLKRYYTEVIMRDGPGVPPFESLTDEQRMRWEKTINFSRYKLRLAFDELIKSFLEIFKK